ncbi:hypothetical protein, partial [Mitsuaria sp. TWR114]|uniref:hypothetical protein n=1 Tax=Mitsuaria sp. TWR114 TaxID=2601731 RepID=UPI001C9B7D6E
MPRTSGARSRHARGGVAHPVGMRGAAAHDEHAAVAVAHHQAGRIQRVGDALRDVGGRGVAMLDALDRETVQQLAQRHGAAAALGQ